MHVKKILIKTLSGNPVGILTLRRDRATDLPEGLRFTLCERGKDLHLFSIEDLSRFSGEESLSLLGLFGEEKVFATTLLGEDAAFAKWRLLQADAAAKKLPTHPLKEQAEEAQAHLIEVNAIPQEPPTEEENHDLPKIAEEDLLTRIKKLILSSPPFTLFDDLMPGSLWAIADQAEGTLIGLSEEDPPRALFGVPGTRDCPPDTQEPSAFFPTDEEGKAGYYLSELKEEDL